MTLHPEYTHLAKHLVQRISLLEPWQTHEALYNDCVAGNVDKRHPREHQGESAQGQQSRDVEGLWWSVWVVQHLSILGLAVEELL